jgi:carboxyl-terminal processing protease
MKNRANTAVLTAISVIVGVLLVAGGFLLGKAYSNEEHGLQQEVLAKLQASYYKEVDPDIAQIAAIDGMLAALDDPWTVYMDPEEYASFLETTAGSYSGVGMTVQMKERLVTIVNLFEGSPAAQAGIKEGDIVLSVDGVSTEGQTLDEVVGGIKGKAGTEVTLAMYRPPLPAATTTTEVSGEGEREVEDEDDTTTATIPTAALDGLPEGGTTMEYTLTREHIEIPTTDRETVYADGEEVALITLYTFSETAADDLRAEVQQAVEEDAVAAIILDLRGNGGGLLNAAIEVAGIFVEDGVITSTEGLHSPEQVYEAVGDAYTDVPLYVLTDGNTASASEIVSGALQDYDRATLVGETTFGKGLVQSIESLSDGGALKLTTAVYLTPNGRDINKTGIVPDVVAPDDPLTPDVDEGVEAVLELISAGSATR